MSFPFKVCCIQNLEEAKLASQYGAAYLGFVSAMPTGFRLLTDEQIKALIIETFSLPSKNILLTSLENEEALIQQIKFTNPDAVQIVNYIDHKIYKSISKEFPSLEIFQVIHVNDSDDIQRSLAVESYVDFILLDSGKSKKNKKALGGTGAVHDWNISAKIVEAVSKPVFLAGGLHPSNVKEAIEKVKPYGVDICTGLRDPKYIVEEKLEQLINEIG